MLQIRSTPTEAKQTGYINDQSTESEIAKFHTPAIPNTIRDCVKENSLENISPDPVQSTLPRLDTLPRALFDSKSEDRRKSQNHYVQMDLHWRYLRNKREVFILQDLESQQERTLGSQPAHSVTFICKDTIASGSVEYQLKMLNFELYISY